MYVVMNVVQCSGQRSVVENEEGDGRQERETRRERVVHTYLVCSMYVVGVQESEVGIRW